MQNSCLSCNIVKGKVKSLLVYEDEYFHAHQDYEVPIPGFIIVSSKRHIKSVDEFTSEEQRDFGVFLAKVRKAMKDILAIETVYIVQKEKTKHHFHVWLLPRYEWMGAKFGTSTESISKVLNYAKESLVAEENLKEVKEASEKLYRFFH